MLDKNNGYDILRVINNYLFTLKIYIQLWSTEIP